jgi:hypothetical protein
LSRYGANSRALSTLKSVLTRDFLSGILSAMTEDDLRQILCKEVCMAGSIANWAREKGISPSYVRDVMKARRAPGDRITEKLGLRRIPTYEYITETAP